MVGKEFVDEFDDRGRSFQQLREIPGIHDGKRFGLAALESDMDSGGAFLRKLDQCHIFDDVGEQTFALSIRRIRIIPDFLEVCCHRDQPLANRIVQQKLIVLPRAFSLFPCLSERAQFVVPYRLKRAGNEAIARVDEHESTLPRSAS